MVSQNPIGPIHNIFLTYINFKHHNAFHHPNIISLFHKIKKQHLHGQTNLLHHFKLAALSRIAMLVIILQHYCALTAEYIRGGKIMKVNWVMEIQILDLNHA